MSLAYEPTENPCYNNLLFWHYAIKVFQINAHYLYIHDSMNFIASFDVKHCQYFHWINGGMHGAIKSLLKQLKIISMVFEKLYRNTLK